MKKGHRQDAPFIHDKDNTFRFDNPIRQRIYESLLSGNKYTSESGGRIFKTGDFRSHIRYIRNAGVEVSDYWKHGHFSRYKVYFIKLGL